MTGKKTTKKNKAKASGAGTAVRKKVATQRPPAGASKTRAKAYGGISNAAVANATGKTWAQWLKALDGAGCCAMAHKQIAALVNDRFDAGAWWSQMITVGYEQARGLRVKNQKADGFSVNISRTLAGSAGKFFDCFADESMREAWLKGAPMTIRTSTRGKSLRITWGDRAARGIAAPKGTAREGATHVDVLLYPKPGGRTQITIQHNKLAAERDVEPVRRYWAARLETLGELVGH